MSKLKPARQRTPNWKSSNEALKRGGSLLIRRDKAIVRLAPKAGHPGEPPVFSDAAIQFRLMATALFALALRPTTGMGTILNFVV